jgi:hypothetical protein
VKILDYCEIVVFSHTEYSYCHTVVVNAEKRSMKTHLNSNLVSGNQEIEFSPRKKEDSSPIAE